MIFDNVQYYFDKSSGSLSSGSYLSEADYKYLISSESIYNYPIGNSDKEFVKIEVISVDGLLVTESIIKPSGEYTLVTGSYERVDGSTASYSYSTYQNSLICVGDSTRSLFIDVAEQLRDLSIPTGNYRIGIQIVRDLVGSATSSNQRLLVQEISPSRTEAILYPSTLRTDSSDEAKRFLNECISFASQSHIQVSDVFSSFEISDFVSPDFDLFVETASQNYPDGMNSLLGLSSLTSVSEVVNFTKDIYYGVESGSLKHNGEVSPIRVYGIYEQFNGWMKANYFESSSFQELVDTFYSLTQYISQTEVGKLYIAPPYSVISSSIVPFLTNVFFDQIFSPIESKIEENFTQCFRSYFSNFLAFDNGTIVPILNTKIIPSNSPTIQDQIVVKLFSPLDSSSEGESCWVTNLFASQPIIQDVYFFSKTSTISNRLKGPDFTIRMENEGNGTEILSIENVVNETGSFYDDLNEKFKIKLSSSFSDTLDYSKLENFVNFSSAEMRLSGYSLKKSTMDVLTSSIQVLDAKLLLNPTDVYYLKQKSDAQSEYNDLLRSFDGYENFLFKNPGWFDSHSFIFESGETSASLFDKGNRGSLLYSVPEFISENPDNNDYVTFVAMIGHFFDNLSIFIKQFTDKNNHSSKIFEGISTGVIDQMLRSLGMEPEIARENIPILLSSFSKADFDPSSSFYSQTRNMSETDRNKVVWKRLLNTLPLIYKTKGTEASVNAIISCFGVPKNVVKVKEYGSLSDKRNDTDKSLYLIESLKSEPIFSGFGEYFQTNWSGSVQSTEFNVRFDDGVSYTDGKYIYLVRCSDSIGSIKWNIGVVKDKGSDWGEVFFNVSGSAPTSIITEKLPIFDGNTYSVLLRRNDVDSLYNLTSSLDQVVDLYPTKYEIIVKRSGDNRITFQTSASAFFNNELNGNFRSGSNVKFGDIEAGTFLGSLDEIKMWEIPLSDTSFDHHVLYRGAYDSDDPQNTVDKNLIHISFDEPINLHSSSSVLSFGNMAFRTDFPNILAYNFPKASVSEIVDPNCPDQTIEVEKYPYQFSVSNVNQTISVPSYGPSQFKSNKVNYIQQSLAGALSLNNRASIPLFGTTTTDSNKVGIFVSPIDDQNEEILKFFGDFQFEDLIGDPRSVYESTYKKYEKFKEIYFDQGFGVVDYQTFMNLAQAYLDKSMFKYIETVIPARANLVSGILVEPTILERPKIQFKRPDFSASLSSGSYAESGYVSGYWNGTTYVSGGFFGS